MSQEPLPSSPVKLVTAAYLDQSYQTESPLPEAAVPTSSHPFRTVIWPLVKLLPGLAIGLVLIAIPINLLTAAAKEKHRPTCGVDWLLWAVGSEKTFESVLTDNLEKSRRDMERRMEESQPKGKPFEIKEFNLQQSPWHNPPKFGARK